MATQVRSTIGGNGFTTNVDFMADKFVTNSVTLRQLANNADALAKVVNRLNKILATMPEELFMETKKDLYNAGEIINNVAGMIGAAHDARLEA